MMSLPNTPQSLPCPGNTYTSAPRNIHPFCRLFPGIAFYWSMCATLRNAAAIAKRGDWSAAVWIEASRRILEGLERSGVSITIRNMDSFITLESPCVFISNHMSTLETFLLPGIIHPHKPVTFVVKESLLRYPYFRHVMRATAPIVVARKDPRADFATVMTEGCRYLEQGISVVVFPQSTRTASLDPSQFNSLGIKLARKAGVPAIPLALRSDAWGLNGLFGLLKDHGPINPAIPVSFAFGPPIAVTGNGKAEHAQVYEFIRSCLEEWGIHSPRLLQAAAGTGGE